MLQSTAASSTTPEMGLDVRAVIRIINFAFTQCGLVYLGQLRQQFDDVTSRMSGHGLPNQQTFDTHFPSEEFSDNLLLVNLLARLGVVPQFDEAPRAIA